MRKHSNNLLRAITQIRMWSAGSHAQVKLEPGADGDADSADSRAASLSSTGLTKPGRPNRPSFSIPGASKVRVKDEPGGMC